LSKQIKVQIYTARHRLTTFNVLNVFVMSWYHLSCSISVLCFVKVLTVVPILSVLCLWEFTNVSPKIR